MKTLAFCIFTEADISAIYIVSAFWFWKGHQ